MLPIIKQCKRGVSKIRDMFKLLLKQGVIPRNYFDKKITHLNSLMDDLDDPNISDGDVNKVYVWMNDTIKDIKKQFRISDDYKK